MKPQVCPSCGAHEFIEKSDAYICAYCDTQYPRTKPAEPVPVAPPVQPKPVLMPIGTPKNKWVALVLCYFFGIFGAHKFYEGRKGLGLLYLFTFGLFSIGWLVDLIVLLFKPNPYYV